MKTHTAAHNSEQAWLFYAKFAASFYQKFETKPLDRYLQVHGNSEPCICSVPSQSLQVTPTGIPRDAGSYIEQ